MFIMETKLELSAAMGAYFRTNIRLSIEKEHNKNNYKYSDEICLTNERI